MHESPFQLHQIFSIGPVRISTVVVTTWVIIVWLGLFCWWATRRLEERPDRLQALLEWVVETIASQIRGVVERDPRPFLPLLGTLFIYLVVANLAGIVPGVSSPTGHLETPAALGAVVFLSVQYYGVSSHGVLGYLRSFLKPNPLMLPINIVSSITRVFSLMVRLFGNIASHELIIAIIVSLAGLLVPLPLMFLGVLIGLVQAYIFTILATVFVGAAVGEGAV